MYAIQKCLLFCVSKRKNIYQIFADFIKFDFDTANKPKLIQL